MNTLLESGARPYGSRKSTIVSMLLHGGLIVAAIIGTSHSVLPPREAVEEHTVLYVAPPPQVHVTPPPPLPEIEKPRTPEPPAKTPAPRRPRVQAPAPAPKPRAAAPRPAPAAAPAMPSVSVPTDIPVNIPVPSAVAATTIGPPSPPSPAAEPAPQRAATPEPASGAGTGGRTNEVSSGDVDRTFTEFQVERAVEVTRTVVPRYPESLRSVNVEGEVVLQFVVDANGRVEGGSIKVISSPNKLFTDAARTALLESRYRPAEAGGNKVRQLAQQVFTFKLQ